MLLDASAITNAYLISAIVNCVCPACESSSRTNQRAIWTVTTYSFVVLADEKCR
jgi:hypothetical protein